MSLEDMAGARPDDWPRGTVPSEVEEIPSSVGSNLTTPPPASHGHASIGEEEIESRFGVHKATIEGENATLPKHQLLRQKFKEFAKELDDLLEHSREKATAFTHLEDASMWAHKAIAKTAPVSEEHP